MKRVRYVFMNLDEDGERRRAHLKEFPGVPWVRFPACRGGVMWGEIARGLGWLGNIRETYAGKATEPRWGTIGCTLSHLFCLRMAAVCGGIVLFPDDLRNTHGHDLRRLVTAALKHRPGGVGWIKLKNSTPVYQGEPHVSGGWSFHRLVPASRDVFEDKTNLGSGAVIILQRQAKAILEALPPVTSRGIDYELRAIMDEVPGRCWEMAETGIIAEPGEGRYGGSSRRWVDKQGERKRKS